MVYTKEDAQQEVGNSTDLIVGLEVSVKKWEQIVAGDEISYDWGGSCGVCFVMRNIVKDYKGICEWCAKRFGAPLEECECHFLTPKTNEDILQHLKDTLQHERWHFGSCISSRPTP